MTFPTDEPDGLSTKALIGVIQSRNHSKEAKESALKKVYEKYTPEMLQLVWGEVNNREDAKDIVADVWLLALRKDLFGQFSYDQETDSTDPVKSWLMQAAKIMVKEHFRNKDKVASSDALESLEAKFLDEETEQHAASLRQHSNYQLDRILKDAKNILTPDEYQAIILTYFNDLNATEIGKLLGMNPGTVRQNRFRALKKLRQSVVVQSCVDND